MHWQRTSATIHGLGLASAEPIVDTAAAIRMIRTPERAGIQTPKIDSMKQNIEPPRRPAPAGFSGPQRSDVLARSERARVVLGSRPR
jgi:hypothetical protein